MPVGTEEMHFLQLGVQYYVAARAAARAGLLPVCGNLFHHAIEAFLKARLSLKHSLKGLKKLGGKTGHELPALWGIFKAEFPDAGLEQFDATIAEIHSFERLRYPDVILKRGAAMVVGKFDYVIGQELQDRYEVDLPMIDQLIARILKSALGILRPSVVP